MDELSEIQQNNLAQFQAISGLDEQLSFDCLSAHNWNLEQSLNSLYSESAFDQASSSINNQSTSNIQNNRTRNNTTADHGSSHVNDPLLPAASSVASAPPRQSQRGTIGNVTRPTPSLLSILFTPLIWSYKFVWSIVSFAYYLLPFSNYNRIRNSQNNDPKNTAKTFIAYFKKRFGDKSPPFFEGSYTQALDIAKKDLKYLLVMLYSEDHDDTLKFCRETFVNDVFVGYLRRHEFLVWGGNIKDSEPYKVSLLLGATCYPFMAVIGLHESKMKVIHRFEGLVSPDRFIEISDRIINQLNVFYATARAERASREAARSIREQQDAAYLRSLEADREKAELARKEQALKEQEEELKRSQEFEIEKQRELKLQRKLDLAASIPDEPDANTPNITKLNIRLPNGDRLIRIFDADTDIQNLYDFVESQDLEPIDLLSEFVIVNTYPRRQYDEKNVTFRQAGLFPNATVVVEEVESDYDEEDDE
ncbi:hypothetical protein BC833DRAFT_582547 [Globomyces pollinis-pini]|nr:hypothetical protein BC833DRAFT_582547 [Globomyces pollinis-pini]